MEEETLDQYFKENDLTEYSYRIYIESIEDKVNTDGNNVEKL